MRLQISEINAIKSITQKIFGEGSRVILFGSRVYDNVKGGDIDLYLQTPDDSAAAEKKIKYLVALKSTLGDQKIDVILSKDRFRPIEQEAIKNGIEL